MGIPDDENAWILDDQWVDILRGLIWLVMGVALYWAIRELFGKEISGPKENKPDGEEMVRDPQCGVYIPVSSAMRKKAGGKTVFFCSRECEEEFSRKSNQVSI